MKKCAIKNKSTYLLFGVAVGLTSFVLCPKSVSADIYKNEAECIRTNTTAASDPQSVKALCTGIIYPIPKTQTQIHYEKEKLEKTTLPIEKFLEVQRERDVNWQERKREEEKEERIRHQEEQKRAYCQMLLAEASRIIDQEEKRGVPRYWSEHYVRGAYSDYSKCKWYK
jgi:hypothetical protein